MKTLNAELAKETKAIVALAFPSGPIEDDFTMLDRVFFRDMDTSELNVEEVRF